MFLGLQQKCDRSVVRWKFRDSHCAFLVDSEIPMIPPQKHKPKLKDLFSQTGKNDTSFMVISVFGSQGDLRFSRRAFGDAHRVPWVENNVVSCSCRECRGFPKITAFFVRFGGSGCFSFLPGLMR